MGALVLAAISARLGVVAVAQTRLRRAGREKYRFLLGLVATSSHERPQTVWLESTKLVAFSLPGRPGIIVATEGLRLQLAPSAVEATLEHERAHLRGGIS